jgi:hypothetical protein
MSLPVFLANALYLSHPVFTIDFPILYRTPVELAGNAMLGANHEHGEVRLPLRLAVDSYLIEVGRQNSAGGRLPDPPRRMSLVGLPRPEPARRGIGEGPSLWESRLWIERDPGPLEAQPCANRPAAKRTDRPGPGHRGRRSESAARLTAASRALLWRLA